ncbi:MAG: ribosome rescue GTPase HflX [Pseudomonadota bacterium]|nr:GTPase HflX [Gammaproteobacteria bacterium]MBU1558869.1 GTPase HflX [Gammaproteobacteria bacterium]MBU1628519.1 GTPase HflX [Gammaproteobacteria bacterium]MBU1927286.1 GTPase HflX [Gammaproteobacteria bacterium]MBU2546335.1 GTPase HflX [Gammaproteobacteria bacterium]
MQIERAILVQIDFGVSDFQQSLDEFKTLVVSAGLKILTILAGRRTAPNPKYFVGQGKAEEILDAVQTHQADVVIFNHLLSPAQERNLETLLHCRVIDRTELILDIFAQRARTFEGKLQVELAQLEHLSTRLVHGWTHLERQKGGIGLRGPGETQLETDRRLIRQRIKHIKSRLLDVRKHRQQLRRKRMRSEQFVVSLVGYTNAGKSTLFNQLTQSDVYVADQLFATLDPTVRSVSIPSIGNVMLIDTVGFIRDLPHSLIDAFRATLEETLEADLLLHVVDISDESRQQHMEVVENVLRQIGAGQMPRLIVYNKIDLVSGIESAIERDEQNVPQRVWISAVEEEGLPLLKTAISEAMQKDQVHCCLLLTSKDSKLRAALHQRKAVLNETFLDQKVQMEVKLPYSEYLKLCARGLSDGV